MIYNEYELTRQYLAKLTGHHELMADYPVDNLSIQMRERIVLPLLTIQQYGLTRIREMDEQQMQSPMKSIYEKTHHALFLWDYQCGKEFGVSLRLNFSPRTLIERGCPYGTASFVCGWVRFMKYIRMNKRLQDKCTCAFHEITIIFLERRVFLLNHTEFRDNSKTANFYIC